MKNQCEKCGRMLLIAQIEESPNQMFTSAIRCSKCVNQDLNEGDGK